MMKKIAYVLLSLVFMNLSAQDPFYQGMFKLGEVKLLDGEFKHAQDLNIDILLQYDTDRLLEPYLTEAGIKPKGLPYTNWTGLAGHVGGHYLSAMAINYATTGNEACKTRMDYMLTELKACQEANGNGYLGGVPNSKTVWAQLKEGNFTGYKTAWVPWYNLHKIYAGLRDAYIYGGSHNARAMLLDLCDWGIDVTSNLSAVQVQTMLDVEFGGMNEVYADAYQMTQEAKYLAAAKRFTHDYFFNAFVQNNDVLDNQHANTQIPKFIGFERVYQVDKSDDDSRKAALNFWNHVVKERSLALGGNSRVEHFPAPASCGDYVTSREGPESCNTYNMLKLSADLFCDAPKVEYVDFYERALYNHILSAQHPDHGGYVYFTPARPRHYRTYSSPNQAMWCCVGSGMENPGLHEKFIYSHRGDSLFVNLFIPSELRWTAKDITLTQLTEFPYADSSLLTIASEKDLDFSLMLRYPSWVTEGQLQVKVNGESLAITAQPGDFIAINRTWKNGDEITLKVPMHTSFEPLPNVPDYIAFMHGPILLGAKTGTEHLEGLVADDGRWSHIANGELEGLYTAPIVVGERDSLLMNIVPIESEPLHFTAQKLFKDQQSYIDLVLEPFYGIHDARYMMYWLSLNEDNFHTIVGTLQKEELEKLELDKRTIDQIGTGEQQPEADHKFQSSNSYSGTHMNIYWRDARDGGYFSYEMATGLNQNLALYVKYWGNEGGSRNFDILVGSTVIATENVVGKWGVDDFVTVEYQIPNNLVKDKEFITVKFQAKAGNVAGGVFFLRLLKELP
ncbi:MAG: glycoside hydrolase family 127 protein, partial [Bacteroidales bacterium]|nr:glycoside hydrolase family 127 protein [Bacteroidales bacterium]